MRYAGTVAVFLLTAAGGVSPQTAEAQNLIMNSGTTTITSAQICGSTAVAENGGNTATVAVTSAGTLTNGGDLAVGISGTGALNVTGRS